MFMLPNHQQKYKSIIGSLCTIFILSIVLVYAIYKFELLVAKDESRLQTTVEESYYDETYTFSSSQGFNMAFGISSYQNSDLYYNDPRFHEYGRLQLLLHTRDSEKGIIKTEVIPFHKCNLI